MLYDLVFLVLLFALIYSYMTSQDQFTATASAIREIWSGSCRLSCRQSVNSGLSGLSGLPGPPHALESKSSKPGSDGQGQIVPRRSVAGPSHNCNCQASCPCALIENFLRTCRPATNIYGEVIKCLSICVTFVLQLLGSAYEYTSGVSIDRRPQIQAQPVDKSSHENFSYERGDKKHLLENPSQPVSNKPDADAVPMRSDEPEAMKQGTSKDVPPTNTLDKDAVNKPESSEESMADKGYCSKCIEKGRTCLKECPRAAKNTGKK